MIAIEKKELSSEVSILNNLFISNNRYEFICDFLALRNIKYSTQEYNSVFGIGKNIIVEYISNSTESIIITAHYDDCGIYDNSGGVLHTLNLCEEIFNNGINKNVIFIFSDQEENFQQGVYYFLQNNNIQNIKFHINIDGIGIGEELVIYNSIKGCLVVDWLDINNEKVILLTDNSPFTSLNINSLHLFSCKSSDALKTIKEQNLHNGFKPYFDENWCIANFRLDFFKSIYLKKSIRLLSDNHFKNTNVENFRIVN